MLGCLDALRIGGGLDGLEGFGNRGDLVNREDWRDWLDWEDCLDRGDWEDLGLGEHFGTPRLPGIIDRTPSGLIFDGLGCPKAS